MDLRPLGRSGLHVPALSFGTMTFGDDGFYAKVGSGDPATAERLVSLCLEAGATLFDSADTYSAGNSEVLLGRALGRRRAEALIATKAYARVGPGAMDAGSSRRHLIEACEASLRRLGTDWIDLYQLHGFDSLTPLEETLAALDDLVRSGKVRYVGCSNFAGWQLMKALGLSERERKARFVGQQIYYSLIGREAEHELLPLSADQGVGVIVWSPLAFGFLSGKFRRGGDRPAGTRLGDLPSDLVDWDKGFDVLDVVVAIAAERGVSPAQVSINWLLRKPGVSTVLIGARTEAQLRDNLGAAGWALSEEEVARLDAASKPPLPYPLWHQYSYGKEFNPRGPSYRA